MSEIKWAYDESSGTFSALPASNFLLAALGFVCLLPLLESGYKRYRSRPKPCPKLDRSLNEKYTQRYKALLPRYLNGDKFTAKEYAEWRELCHPPWAEPGELWVYPID